MLHTENKEVKLFINSWKVPVVKIVGLFVALVFFSTVSAQISTLTAWTNVYHGTSNTQTPAVVVPAGSGKYRCLVVAIASNRTAAGARTVVLSYGGQNLTSAAGDIASSLQQHTQLYYLNEAGLDAATSTTLSFTITGGTTIINDFWYAIYDGIDQTTPTTDSKTYNSGATNITNPVFAVALNVNANDLAVEVISSHRTSGTTPRTITAATNWTLSNEQTNSTTSPIRNAVASRSVPVSNSTDLSSTTFSNTSLASMTAITLRSAKQFRSNQAAVTWGTAGHWQQSTDGGTTWVTATTVPTSADKSVTILSGHTVTLSAASSASSLIINSSGALNTSATNTNTLTVTGTTDVTGTLTLANTGTKTFTGNITLNAGAVWNETGAAAFNLGGDFVNNATTFTASTGVHTFSGAAKVMSGSTITAIPNTTVSGTYTNNHVLTVSTALSGSGTLTQGVGAVLNIGTASAITGLVANTLTNTVNYTGVAQTVKAVAYNNLGLSGSGAKALGTTGVISGNLILSGTAVATTGAALTIGGNLTVGTGCTFATGTTSAWTLGITGTTDVTGTLTLANTGTKTFTGNITLNATSVWNETAVAAFSIGGDLVNNAATFTASTGVHTFSGATKTISGSTTVAIPSTTVTGSYTNTGVMTVSTALAGAGSLTQGNSSTLNIGGSSTITTLTATATGNTVNYTGGAQTAAKVTTYMNLTITGAGLKTFSTTPTVNGILSLEQTGTIIVTTGVVTYGSAATLQYNKPAGNTVSSEEWISPFMASGGVIIKGAGAVSLEADKILGNNTNVPLNINSGATLNTLTRVLTLHGDFINGGGVLTGTTGGVVITGTVATQNIGAYTTTGPTLMSKTSGTATLTGNVNGAALTIAGGAPAILNLGSGLTHILSGIVTLTSGTLNGGSSILQVNATSATAWTGTGSLFVSGTGTVSFGGVAQTITTATTFNNLTLTGTAAAKTIASGTALTGSLVLSGTATTTLPAGLTIGGSVTLGTGTTFTAGAFTHTIGGNWVNNGGTFTNTGSTINFNGTTQTIGGTTATTFNHLSTSGSTSTSILIAATVAGNLTIGNGTTFTAGAFALTVTGTTTVGAGTSGSLIISSATGTKTFNGDLTVGSGAAFTNSGNAALTLPGNLSNSGTFTAGSGIYTFSGLAKIFSGSAATAIPSVTVTGSLTNNGNLTVATALAGAGSFEMGLTSALTLGGTNTVTTFDASANASVVTYNSSTSAQTLKAATYDGLTISNSNISGVTLGGTTIVEGTLTFTAGTLSLSTFNLNVQGAISGATSTRYVKTNNTGKLVQTVSASSITFPVGNTAYNPITITNAGTTDDYSVRVVDAVTAPVPANTAFLVNRYWNITEAVAGESDLSFIVQWNTGEPLASYAGGSIVKMGYYNGLGWTEYPTTQSGAGPFTATGSFNVSGDDLTTERTFGVGKDAGFISGSTITVSSVAAFGNQCQNTTSAERTYTVSGVNLTNDIVITPPAGYQISTTSGSGFVSTPITLTKTGGTVSPTTMYVRFTPTSVTTFNLTISHTSSGATTKTVPVTGAGVNLLVTITAPTSASIGATNAILGGNITDIGCSSATERGIYWSLSNGFADGTGTKVSDLGTFSAGVFTKTVTGLTANTIYYYKAFATNSAGAKYSVQGTFTTAPVARYSVGTSPMDWNNANNWSATSGGTGGAGIPASGNAVFIEGSRIVTITAAATVGITGTINIASGSTLTYTAASSLTLATGTMNINGTFARNSTGVLTVSVAMNVNSGGKYTHAVNGIALPAGAWNANSTCEVTGRTATALTGLNQTFGHFIWNCTGQSTAQNLPDATTMSLLGDLTIGSTNAQNLVLNQTSLSVINYTHTTGIFNLNSAGSGTKTVNVSGNYSHTTGTLSNSGGGSSRGAIVFNGSATQTFTSGGTLSGTIDFTINNGATVNFGTNIIASGSTGTFDVLAGGTLITAHSGGISTTAATGVVQVTGIKSYSNSAATNYVFNGSVAQSTGNGYTGGGDLTIDNAAGVSLTSNANINGILSIGLVTANSIFADNGKTIATNLTGTLNLVSGTYKLGSTAVATSFPAYASVDLASGTTVEYLSNQTQTVSVVPSYQHLSFSGSGQKNVSGALSVAGNLSTTGGVASLGSSTVTVAGNVAGNGAITFTSGTLSTMGNWVNTGTLTGGTGTVIFNGTAQTIGNGTLVSFNNLTLSNTNTKTLGAAISSSGLLDVNNAVVLNTANFDVTLTGDLVNNGTLNGGSSLFIITGGATQNIDKFATSGEIRMTKSAGIATFTNDINGGSLTVNSTGGSLSLGAGNDIRISGNWTYTNGILLGGTSTLFIGGASSSYAAGTFTGEDGTVDYNGTAQVMAIVPYNNLTVSGSGAKSGAVTTVNGNLTVNGTATITTGAGLTVGGALHISDGTTFTAAGFALTVNGVTTVGDGVSGVLTISSVTGTKIFNEDVAIGSGASFNNNSVNAPLTFAGSISNTGTFNAGTGLYTLSGTDRSVSGTLAIPNITVTGTYSNEGIFTVATALAGAGTLSQGLGAVLNIGGALTITELEAFENANTVNYTAAATQTVKAINYNNLGISGAGNNIKTLGGNVIVSGTVTIAASTVLSFGTTATTLMLSGTGTNTLANSGTVNMSGSNALHVLQIAASSIASIGTLTTGTGSTVDYNASGAQTIPLVTYNHLTLSGSGAKTISATSVSGNILIGGTAVATTAAILSVGGTLNVGTGTTLTMGSFAISVTGASFISGTVNTATGLSGTRTFTGTVTINSGGVWNLSGQNPPTSFAGGIVMSGTTFNNGSGAAAFSANQALSGAGNILFGGNVTPAVSTTLTNNNTGTVTITGTLTLTGNFTQGLNSTVLLPAATPFGGAGSFTANSNVNTVNYSRSAGGQTVRATNYYHLVISNSSGTTILASSGTIGVAGTFTPGSQTFTITGSTINFNGVPPQSITSFTYQNLTLGNGSGTHNLGGAVTTSGILTFSGGKLALGSNTLTLNGTISGMTASSCLVADGTSNITIGGSGSFGTSLFFDQSDAGTSNRLNNLIYNRASQTFTLGDTLEIAGTITPTAGTLATSNKLKLISDETATARMAAGSGSYISGNVSVECFIPSSARRWRFLGTPVSGTTLADFKNETYITGVGGATNGFDATVSNYAGVYSYNEAVITGDLNTGYVAATHITNGLTIGKGYRVFIRGDRSDPGRLDGTNSTQNDVTLNLVGPLNTGNISLPVTFTSSGIAANDGWNLVSNPYASQIDWNAFHDAGRTGTDPNFSGTNYAHIKQTVYIYDAGSGSYVSYNALSNIGVGSLSTGIIPGGTAFWVQAMAASPSITMLETFKTASAPAAVFKTSNEQFVVKLTMDEITSDETTIKYVPEADNGLDAYDIAKLYGSDINIASIGADGSFLSANCKRFNGHSDTIPLSVGFANSGDYKMEFIHPENLGLEADKSIYLVDVFKKRMEDLITTSEYTFTVDKNDPLTFGNGRFMLVVAKVTTAIPEFESEGNIAKTYLYPTTTNGFATIYNTQAVSGKIALTITDLSGKTVANIQHAEWVNNELPVDLRAYQSGLYFITIIREDHTSQTLRCIKE